VPIPDNFHSREDEEDAEALLGDNGEIPETGDLNSGDDITSTRGVFYQMGDLVEMS
jgi:hypothetical protein